MSWWLAMACTLAFGQPSAVITGKVFGGSGIIIPNAQVRVTNTADGRAALRTCDYNGRYEVRGLAAGTYLVEVASFDVFPALRISLREGEHARADLRARRLEVSPPLAQSAPLKMADLAGKPSAPVSITEVSDYVYGGYRGTFTAPPDADLNPKKAFVIRWRDFPYRFVFWHEASYCPWFELPSGAALSYQFFEGNAGWAELFNEWGRQERNSFIEILESGPRRVWVRWTYFGVNIKAGEPAYRATENFWAYPNGLILRRQSYRTLKPGDPRGYAREPIETIALCPAGKLWYDILEAGGRPDESHALAVLDPYSEKRYDVFWKRQPGTLWGATPRRTGAAWKELDDARGVALIVPMHEGAPFCVFGDASGFRHDFTRIKDHSFTDTGGLGWISKSWDHWPIGWLNSQEHPVNQETLGRYPNHFSPAGMDFFALPNEECERGVYYSLIGVGGANLETIRKVAKRWLAEPHTAQRLPAVFK
jgi:hypothetical protein